MKHLCAITFAVLLAACFPVIAGAQAAGGVRQMAVERLPDLNVAMQAAHGTETATMSVQP